MANTEHHPNGLFPGTTFPEKVDDAGHLPNPSATPPSFEGPQVNGRSTTVTLFAPSQLAKSPLLPSLVGVIILAFRHQGHEKDGATVVNSDRFQYDGQLLDELSNAPGTFTYVLYYSGTEEVVATASAKRYMGAVEVIEPPNKQTEKNEKGNTFTRFWTVPDDTEAWELSTMAVDAKAQKQGLAGYLMRLTEDEVKRRFRVANSDTPVKKLVQMITTIKEVNGVFYSKKGFTKDYEKWYEPGHLGSENGFTIIHMSKLLE